MKAYIVFLPSLIAAWYSWFYSPSRAFLNVYIPCLLLLPILYKLELSGFPDFGFAQAALPPIVILHVLRQKFHLNFRIHLIDALVIGYIAASVYSEYTNTGLYETEKGGILWITLLANKITVILLPYLISKWLIIPKKISIPLAKRIIVLLIITLILCAWEWRMVVNTHITFFGWFFPGQESWIPTYRYGLVRISGPFPHPILLGIAFGVALLLNYWLIKNKFWEKNFSFLPPLPLSKGVIYGIILAIGLLFTISRAPIISTCVASLFLGVGYSTNRVKSFIFRFMILIVLGFIAYNFIAFYSNIDRRLAESQLTGSAVYRIEMLYKYIPLVQEKLWWGWGYSTLPKKAGLLSIDNEYLWILLRHGIFALLCYAAIFAIVMIKLLRRGLDPENNDLYDRSFSFTMLSIYFMLGVSLITVYMGGQIAPLFFVLTGWTQGFLLTNPHKQKVFIPKDQIVKKLIATSQQL